MDVLSEVLKVVKLQGALFYNGEFSSPWSIRAASSRGLAHHLVPGAEHVIVYHLLTEGRASIRMENGETLELRDGDLVMIPHGDPHIMENGPVTTTVDELTRSSAKIQVEAGTKLLQMDLPAILLQPGCTNTLFDARCTLAKLNMLLFSEQLDNGAWVLSNLTVVPNALVAPDGNSTADKLTRVATVGTEASATQTRIAVAGGTPLSLSVYAKAGSVGAFLDLRLIYVDATIPTGVVAFNLSNSP